VKKSYTLLSLLAVLFSANAYAQDFTDGYHLVCDHVETCLDFDVSNDGRNIDLVLMYNADGDVSLEGTGKWVHVNMNSMKEDFVGREGYYAIESIEGEEYTLRCLADTTFLLNKLPTSKFGEVGRTFYLIRNTNELTGEFRVETIDMLNMDLVLSKPYTTPEHVAKAHENIIRNLGIGSFDTYMTEHISIDVLTKMAQDLTITESNRSDVKEYMEEMQNDNEDIKQNYELLKIRGEEYNINWQKIETYQFKFELPEIDDIDVLRGVLYFTEHELKFTVGIGAVFYNDEYHIVFIEELYSGED
jgi:DNA-binding ferritin-like protein (Dps family)